MVWKMSRDVEKQIKYPNVSAETTAFIKGKSDKKMIISNSVICKWSFRREKM